MHKIALEPKELCKPWMDGSSTGVEEVDLGRRIHTCTLLDSLFSCEAINQPVGGS